MGRQRRGHPTREELAKLPIRRKPQTIGHLRDKSTGKMKFSRYPGMSRKPNSTGTTPKRPKKNYDGMKSRPETRQSNMPPSVASSSWQSMSATEVIQDDIPMEDLYLQQLVQEDAYTLVNSMGSVIMVEDFSCMLKQLQKHLFRVIVRKSIKFDDGCYWILMCSCSPNQHNLLQNMDCIQRGIHEEFTALHSMSCLHVRTCQRLMQSIDAMRDITAEASFQMTSAPRNSASDHGYAAYTQMESPVFVLNGDHPVPHLGVILPTDDHDKYGILKLEKEKITCLVCKRSCSHVSFFNRYRQNMTSDNTPEHIVQLIENYESSSECSSKRVRNYKTSSFRSIPFHLSSNLIMKMNAGLEGLAFYDDLTNRYILLPESEVCPHCGGVVILDSIIPDGEDVPVFLRDRVMRADVFSGVCPSCDQVIPYDGQEDTLLNMGHFLIGYDVMRDYLNNFLHGHRPAFTYYQVWQDNLDDRGVDHSELSYHKFLNGWYAFLALLDVDTDKGFSCPKCENYQSGIPDIIVCDGTSLSFRRDMLTGHGLLSDTCYFDQTSTHSNRIFLGRKQVRDLMKIFCSPTKELSDADFRLLLSLLEAHHPTLHAFIMYISDGSSKCPPPYRRFFLNIATNFPMCSMLSSTAPVGELIEALQSGENISQHHTQWMSLQENIPLLFDLFCADKSLLPPPPELMNLINDMWEVSQQTFIHSERQVHQCENAQALRSHFPSLPMHHCRGKYSADRAPAKTKCEKTFTGHPYLLPGIFTIFCEHGICYGFEVMESCESPNIPFTIFNTRFKKAPNVVIYDFACHLHSYCLNRNPEFFRETKFLIDRFHWKNHRACPSTYHLNSYPSLAHLNSQVNEQANAGLKRIKGQLSYMSQNHFMDHCRLFLYNKNYYVRKSLLEI